ncbi:MAG: hypothetical protein ABSC01_07310 [Verrucomicrobiota bacterium]|jgi:hypothetical protein
MVTLINWRDRPPESTKKQLFSNLYHNPDPLRPTIAIKSRIKISKTLLVFAYDLAHFGKR